LNQSITTKEQKSIGDSQSDINQIEIID